MFETTNQYTISDDLPNSKMVVLQFATWFSLPEGRRCITNMKDGESPPRTVETLIEIEVPTFKKKNMIWSTKINLEVLLLKATFLGFVSTYHQWEFQDPKMEVLYKAIFCGNILT